MGDLPNLLKKLRGCIERDSLGELCLRDIIDTELMLVDIAAERDSLHSQLQQCGRSRTHADARADELQERVHYAEGVASTNMDRADAAEADIAEFMRRLDARWFLEQGWFPCTVSAPKQPHHPNHKSEQN